MQKPVTPFKYPRFHYTFGFQNMKLMKTTLATLLFIIPVITFAQRTTRSMNGPRGTIGFYQYLPPGYNSNTQLKHPLIIFLHGIGEKGTGSPEDLKKINCCGIPKYINQGHDMQFTWNGKTEGPLRMERAFRGSMDESGSACAAAAIADARQPKQTRSHQCQPARTKGCVRK